ncbi:MAG: hypothetical protein FJZ64_00775 [Chlamydiae bacterium]|nr:hypothetical protein [Chlamydiota bacterium]
MRQLITSCFLLLITWFSPLGASQQDHLQMGDIHRVMERLFHFHIEKKDFSPSLIRRSVKLYIEQFDLEKAYLLESEIAPYLDMKDGMAQDILSRVQNRNYSDFFALNAVLEKAILRAQAIREIIVEQMLLHPEEGPQIFNSPTSRYATSADELMVRQKNRMNRFYLFHQARTAIDTTERKKSVYSLFEKKIRRFENNYLFLDRDGNALSTGMVERLLTLRILKSFAKSLDTHTVFFSPEEAYEMRLSLERQFEGVGVILSEGIDGVMIADLIEGSPAEQSGQIRINDLLVEIDGKAISRESFEDVLDLLKKKDH